MSENPKQDGKFAPPPPAEEEWAGKWKEHKAVAGIKKHFSSLNPKTFRLSDVDPNENFEADEKETEEALKDKVKELSELQDRLYSQEDWALLVVFQAVDGGGKDSTIKHVLSGINPSGVEVSAFKTPSVEERKHDFLWRIVPHLPERGKMGIFNRSYYEDVLAPRVYPEQLKESNLPSELITKNIWKERFQDINNFEQHLVRNGTLVAKFFIHISADEQRRRLTKRLTDPQKNHKFSANDLENSQHWTDYQTAYEEMVRNTSTPYAPWKVVPGNNKQVVHLAIATALVDLMNEMDLEYPEISSKEVDALRNLLKMRKQRKN